MATALVSENVVAACGQRCSVPNGSNRIYRRIGFATIAEPVEVILSLPTSRHRL